ncbi:hypothetical protein HY045_01995 [Candidatus Woesebacteria bacterium]|nr:hypothetical protein [Candidatus Woesebacteria bacterium]
MSKTAKVVKRFFIISLVIFILVILGSVIFIKTNTTLAAEFTDNVLRPVLGAKNVIFLEKIYFNTSDKIQQVTSNANDVHSPQFSVDTNGIGESTSLDLNNIQYNHKL